MFVLDTNVVSELRKVRSGKANRGLADWASSVPSSWLFLSSIVVHELEHGVLLAERSDPVKGAVLRRWLDTSAAAAFERGSSPSTWPSPSVLPTSTSPFRHRSETR